MVTVAVRPSAAATAARTGAPLLQLTGIVKQFPGCLANDRVDLAIQAGEIHALLGENGAGKSTLVKIIYGVLRPDQGEIRWRGEPVHIANPAFARRLGIGMVFQHFSLFEALTVAENIALGINDPAQRRDLKKRIVEVSREPTACRSIPTARVHDLSVGERQRIEIVRCLLQDPQLLIMDEPTSVLTPQEVERLFQTLRRLSQGGPRRSSTSPTSWRRSARCASARRSCGSGASSPNAIRGRRRRGGSGRADDRQRAQGALPSRDRSRAASGPRLVVQGLSLRSDQQFGTDLKDISLSVAGGEILGIGGVAGNGQTELTAALVRRDAGRARRRDPRSTASRSACWDRRAARSAAAAFVPEERNGHGAVPAMTLARECVPRRASGRLGLVRAGLIAARPGGGLRRQGHPVVRRQHDRPRGRGAQPVRRQSSEVHRRARDPAGARRAGDLAADLGRGCRRRRRDPPGPARSGRCRRGSA